MRQKTALLLLCLILAVSESESKPVRGTFFDKKKAPVMAPTNSYKAKNYDYENLFKEKHTTTKGMITMHDVKGKLYFEIPLNLLDREMLIGSTITEISDNSNGIIGSKPTEPLHVKFTKINNFVQLRRISCDYMTDSTELNMVKAIEASSIGAIMKNMKIEAYSPDSTAVVVDITDFFVSDNKDMTPFDDLSLLNAMGYRRSPTYQSSKSFLGTIKSFSDNVVIQSHLSYTYDLFRKDGVSVAKEVPFTAVVTRSIVLLEEKPYRSRVGDYRMAIFPTAKYFFSEKDQGSRVIYYSNRWNLEPTDSVAYLNGELVAPKKPIVFYIDNNFPDQWKKYIKEGVEQWNELFGTIGFKDVISARDFPTDDPEFDPDNIKYSCIRYAPISIANAMGPSWTDPRSGEILNASVYVYHDIIELLNNWIFIQTSQTDERVRTKNIPEEIIGDALRYVVAHEVGHCLGLMHNMSASAVIPVDSLRSPSFTQKFGTTTSIMDYARFNYVAQPGDFQRGVKMTPPRFGAYDAFSIKWLYTAFPDKTYQQESDTLSKWITDRSGDPVYRYGKQQTYVLDPRSQSEDLGDNAMKASAYGINNLKYIMKNFSSWVDSEDIDFTYRQTIYEGILKQYIRYINHVYANIGGIYIQEMKKGDVGQKYKSVPRATQKEALFFIMNQLYLLDWMDNKELKQKLDLSGSAKDIIETSLIRAIVGSPNVASCAAQKVRFSASLSDDPYTFKECADDIYAFTWKSTLRGQKPSEMEMKMQREFVKSFLLSANLLPSGGGNARGFSESDFLTAITIPDFGHKLSDYNCSSGICSTGIKNEITPGAISGYGTETSPKLFQMSNNEADYYGYLLKTQALLKRSIAGSSGNVRSHYELMLRDIENSFKDK